MTDKQLFRNPMIGLDLSPMDQTILQYVQLLHPILGDALHFTHVISRPDWPVSLLKGRLPQVKTGSLMSQLHQTVLSHLGKPAEAASYHILQGKIQQELLNHEIIHGIDLSFLGMKTGSHSSRQFIRKSKGSVFLAAEGSQPKMKTICVAVDFSEHAGRALQTALTLARRFTPQPEVHVIRIFDVPDPQLYQFDLPEAQIEGIIRDNMLEAFSQFLQKYSSEGTQIHDHLLPNRGKHPAIHIWKKCREIDSDLLILGSRGHSAVGSFLLGSLTEKLISYPPEISLLILRDQEAHA